VIRHCQTARLSTTLGLDLLAEEHDDGVIPWA
jgi:hypothetical protein